MNLFRIAVAVIVAVVATWALSAFVARRRAAVDADGWRRLRPSAMHWAAIVFCGALCLLLLYVRLFVGSSRADAASQMTVLTWLAVGFGLGALLSIWAALMTVLRPVRWCDSTIVFDVASRSEQRRFDEVTGITPNALGQMVVTFADGALLKIDPYASGASELLDLLREKLGPRATRR